MVLRRMPNESGREDAMAVLGLEIARRTPYAGGASFGDAGVYERIDGLVTFGVDPENAANAGIVDLDLAPRDADGLVRFRADLCLLLPSAPQKGSRRLIVELPNRG